PGYGENSRVLKWVFERVAGSADAVRTAIGDLPAAGALDLGGLDVSDADLKELLSVDSDGWKTAIPQIEAHFAQFGEKLPDALRQQLASLSASL
ncbi:MAG: GTP-dependent phosphoenolpyruvate carboxykinase, partial [Actinomycetota bacterium]